MDTVFDEADANNVDAKVDLEISTCLNLHSPKSFFLFAGAGSGKTESLVQSLKFIQKNHSRQLRLHGQRVAVITYTNKACDEIKHRTGFDPLVEVSTIHSFVWTLIQGFDADIKAWLMVELQSEIADLREKQANGRVGKASIDRERSIESKTRRLAMLPEIRKFTYSPNGENRGKDSLNHSEVIKISSSFLAQKPAMQRLLITKFPILLIDESQDTNKMLMESFLAVQAKHSAEFRLGLFGDTMQRIYADGKADLGRNLPVGWAKPAKKMNHRCPKRVISLINKIRSDVDDQEQKPRTDAEDEVIRLFILKTNTVDKMAAEKFVAEKMATIANDPGWNRPEAVKSLILEHHMAATRMGFHAMYEPLYRSENLRIGLLDGSLGGLKLFVDRVLPLIEAKRLNDSFAVASIVKKYSPLLSKAALRIAGDGQVEQIKKAREAVESLWSLWDEGKSPRFIDILRNVRKSGIFEIPESLQPIASRTEDEQKIAETEIAQKLVSGDKDNESVFDNWDEFLLTSFEQAESYADYVAGNASFDTHQGVKGLEFPRVMIILDDSAARGFLFSYDKLFGVKEKTKTDLDHERVGNDTGIDRTRRLFYVVCSRAKKSLVIVAYSENPQKLKRSVVANGWFEENEIEVSIC